MHFTDKEIEQAKQLKEDGLKWEPDVGDHFVHRRDIYVIRDASVDDLSVFAIRSYPYDEDCEFAKCYCTWLPLWHQCRKILADNDIYILLLTKKDDDIQLDESKVQCGHGGQ